MIRENFIYAFFCIIVTICQLAYGQSYLITTQRLQTESLAVAQGNNCQVISGLVFVTTDLTNGLGSFGDDAINETWEVNCPPDVYSCPSPSVQGQFTPLQNGNYLVTYTKTTNNGSDQCQFDLLVTPPGLQFELSWEWNSQLGNSTVDLDLHLHEPGNTNPWGGNSGNSNDCAWNNCTINSLSLNDTINWFQGTMPPDPVDWYLDPIMEKNSCYYTPKGIGQNWQSFGMGCHNPRLDIDNITCDPSITDPNNSAFCNPEISSVDFPPNYQWFRLGVHYYYNHSQSYDVHPKLKVACQNQTPIIIGDDEFNSEVTFTPADGGDTFWLVADVLFHRSIDHTTCVIRPLFDNEQLQTPLFSTVNEVQSNFGPAYLPVVDVVVEVNPLQNVLNYNELIGHHIVINNIGSDPLDQASIDVIFPTELSNSNWTCVPGSGASCPLSGGSGINEVISIPSGSNVTFVVYSQMPVLPYEIAVNTSVAVSINNNEVDPDTTNNMFTLTEQMGIFASDFD